MSQLKIVYDLIVKPSQGMQEITEKKPWLLLFVLLIFGELGKTVGVLLLNPLPMGLGKFALVWGGSTGVFALCVLWTVLAGMLHLSAELWKAEGKASNFFILTGFCFIPKIFAGPLAMILRACGMQGLGMSFLLFIFGIGWVAALLVLAIKSVYSCPVSRAFQILMTPFVVCVLFSVIVPMTYLLSLAVLL